MFISGEIEVHKTDGVTRQCSAALILDDGSIAVWDILGTDDYRLIDEALVDHETGEVIEPDVIATADEWRRVEREGHSWKQTSTGALMERAKRRDDVDEEDINF